MIKGTKHTLKARRAIAKAMKKAIANKKRSIAQKKLVAERKAAGIKVHTNGRPYKTVDVELKKATPNELLGLHASKTNNTAFLAWAKTNLHPAVYDFLSSNHEVISAPTPKDWLRLSAAISERAAIEMAIMRLLRTEPFHETIIRRINEKAKPTRFKKPDFLKKDGLYSIDECNCSHCRK